MKTVFQCTSTQGSQAIQATTPMLAANEYRKHLPLKHEKTRVLVSRQEWVSPLNIDVENDGRITLLTEEGFVLATTTFLD